MVRPSRSLFAHGLFGGYENTNKSMRRVSGLKRTSTEQETCHALTFGVFSTQPKGLASAAVEQSNHCPYAPPQPPWLGRLIGQLRLILDCMAVAQALEYHRAVELPSTLVILHHIDSFPVSCFDQSHRHI
jgi:hypothetical protein